MIFEVLPGSPNRAKFFIINVSASKRRSGISSRDGENAAITALRKGCLKLQIV
jgi:hypothetical protein